MEAMRRIYFLFVFLYSITALIFSIPTSAAESIGKAISLEGEVKFLRDNKTSNIQPGEKLFVGDKVTTGKRSSARFLLDDSTIVDLKESSQFEFKKLVVDKDTREADFNLDFGRMRASVNKKVESGKDYKFKTKATVFAVRGTDFAISASDKEAKLNVFEGTIESKNAAFTEQVPRGFELQSTAKNFKKTKLTNSQIESVFAASRAEDMTFYQSLVVDDFRVSRNFGSATIGTLSKLTTPPSVQIPKDAFKVPGVNPLNASAVSAGILNYVVTTIGVKIQ